MKFRLLVLVVGLALALSGAPPLTTLSIEVKDPFNKPVDNAAVIIDFLASHQITKLGKRQAKHWEVHTNQEGHAEFPPLPQGTLQVQVVAKNYQTFGKKYDVDEQQKTIEIMLNAPQPQYSAHPPLKPADSSPK